MKKPKHFYISILFLLIGNFGFGQTMVFKNISFEDALKLAKQNKQIIFVQLASDCDECDMIAEQGLSGKEISDVFKDFVKIKVQADSEDFKNISKRYRISPTFPTSLFLNHEGYFLEIMYNKSTSLSMEYIKLAAKAMAIKNNPPLAAYTKKYASGKYDTDFLKEFISELSEYNFNTDDLLDDYVETLTINDLFTPDEIKFLLQSAPVIDSKVYRLMRFDYALNDSVFMALPENERMDINHRMIEKSRKKAVNEKDALYMNQVANYIQGTYRDFQKGRKSRDWGMLRFYKEIKDSTNYIRSARRFYQLHLENLDVDSISMAEKGNFILTEDGSRLTGGKLYETGNQINELAWTVYEFTSDPELLGMALKWSERTLVYNIPPYHDTYAHILYKIGAKDKAIEWQQKAVNLSDSLGMENINLSIELEKMKTEKPYKK